MQILPKCYRKWKVFVVMSLLTISASLFHHMLSIVYKILTFLLVLSKLVHVRLQICPHSVMLTSITLWLFWCHSRCPLGKYASTLLAGTLGGQMSRITARTNSMEWSSCFTAQCYLNVSV